MNKRIMIVGLVVALIAGLLIGGFSAFEARADDPPGAYKAPKNVIEQLA